MKDKNGPDEAMHEIEGTEFDEALDETEEVVQTDTKTQIIKYAAAWLAIVALFFVANAGIKNYTAAKNQAAYTAGGSYSGGQPVAGYGTQPAVQGGAYDAAQGAAGAGGCGTGGCGSSGAAAGGGGSCCGGSGAATSANAGVSAQGSTGDFKQVEKDAINWYVSQYGDAEVTAEVQDFGCHQEINIVKDGKVVKELRYQNGQFSPLTPW